MKHSRGTGKGKHNKREKKSKRSKKKRKRYSSTSSEPSSSSDDTSTSTSPSSESEVKNKTKVLKKKRLKRKLKKQKKELKKKESDCNSDEDMIGPAIPNNLVEASKRMAPETKEEWEKRQNVIKKVFDEQTGRYRLIKGDGEILEEIVSRERHKEINKQATLGDGSCYFEEGDSEQ